MSAYNDGTVSATYPEAPVDPGRTHSHRSYYWTIRGGVCSRHLEGLELKITCLELDETRTGL